MRTPLLAAVFAASALGLAHTEAQDQNKLALESLTVPPDRLRSACRLTPSDTTMIDGDSVRSGLWGGLPISSNPWRGTDARSIARIGERVAGPPRVPDGPPLTQSELARFESQRPRVEEAYAAVYGIDGPPVVTVYAARFDKAPVPDPPRAFSGLRIVRDRTVIVIAGASGACSSAVREYIENLPGVQLFDVYTVAQHR